MPEGADGEQDQVYGLLVLGGVEVALPLSALREVVPRPRRLTALPVAAPALVGAMELRELVVPVVDLRVGPTGTADAAGPAGAAGPGAAAADEVVVVVAHADRLVGVLADRVRGVVRVPASALLALTAGGGAPLLVSHTFRHPAGTGVVSVLDASAVLALPGVPTVRDAPRAPAATTSALGSARRRTLTLLRCGPHVLALDVAHVHTTLPGSAPVPSVLDSDLCTGVTTHVDRQVPVVDPLVLLGLGALTGDQGRGAGLVLALDGGHVVLALTALLDIVQVEDAEVLAVPAFSVPRPDLLAGVVEVPGTGQCLVLDGDALAADRQLLALAPLGTAVDGAGPADEAAAPAGAGTGSASTRRTARSYLSYTAGTDVTTALEQVAEILPLPSTHTPTGGEGGAVVGVLVHRAAAVPVLHLPTLLGLTGAPAGPASCVLLVEVDGERVAFAVDALRDIEPLTWQDPEPPRAERGPLLGSPLVQVGDDPRLLREIDLRALARAVRDAGSAPGAVPAPRRGGGERLAAPA